MNAAAQQGGRRRPGPGARSASPLRCIGLETTAAENDAAVFNSPAQAEVVANYRHLVALRTRPKVAAGRHRGLAHRHRDLPPRRRPVRLPRRQGLSCVTDWNVEIPERLYEEFGYLAISPPRPAQQHRTHPGRRTAPHHHPARPRHRRPHHPPLPGHRPHGRRTRTREHPARRVRALTPARPTAPPQPRVVGALPCPQVTADRSTVPRTSDRAAPAVPLPPQTELGTA